MRTLLSRGAAAAGACLIAAALAACGSGSATGGSSTDAAASTTTSTTTVTASSSAPASTTAGGSASGQATRASGAPGCQSSQITVDVGHPNAGMSHIAYPLLFHNTSSAGCSLTGYPGVALVAASGSELQVARTPNGYIGGLSPKDKVNPVVHLTPGQTASALLEGEDFDNVHQKPCPDYTEILVTPPNQLVTRRFPEKVAICDPTVHPVVKGSTGMER